MKRTTIDVFVWGGAIVGAGGPIIFGRESFTTATLQFGLLGILLVLVAIYLAIRELKPPANN